VATKNKAAASTNSTGKAETNRKIKLLRLLKQQPNNEQIKDALANIKYRRKKPKTQEWSKTAIRLAKLFKEFSGRADRELFSNNPKIQSAALSKQVQRTGFKLPEGKVSFLLGARAHDKYGKLVWV
jgi:hypothetical protein